MGSLNCIVKDTARTNVAHAYGDTRLQYQEQGQNGTAKASNKVVASSTLSSSDKTIDKDIIVGNVDEIAGDDVKPKPFRKKKSQIMHMSDPDMFKTIDSHVAKVI